MLSFLPMPIIALTAKSFKTNGFILSEFLSTVWLCFSVFAVVLSPIIALALLNRFLFGKILCVINNDGIQLENDRIQWQEIKRITYIPEVFNRGAEYSRVCVTRSRSSGEPVDIVINHFPVYGLQVIKRICPQIEVKFHKIFIGVLAAIPTLVAVIISVFI